MNSNTKNIPYTLFFQKLDEYVSAGNLNAAELHLKLWLAESEAAGDKKAAMAMLNELVNIYRMLGKQNECISTINSLLTAAEATGIQSTTAYATMMINAANSYKAFNMAGDAINLYEKALPIYEKNLSSKDLRLVSLYNNMALTLTGIGVYKRSYEMYKKAIDILLGTENSYADLAITYLNLACLIKEDKGLTDGEEEIRNYINKASEALDSNKAEKNMYYKATCLKCAELFAQFGYYNLESKYSMIAAL